MRSSLVILALALAAGLAPVMAQAPLKTPAYEPLLETASAQPDPEALKIFTTLRAAVAAKDETRLAALLAPDFAALSCSADPTAPCARAARRASKKPLESLRLALCCGGKDDRSMTPAARNDAMFGLLDSLLQASNAASTSEFGGAVCEPALPAFDKTKAKALAKKLDVDPTAMRLAAAAIEMRAKPERATPIVAKLPKGAVVPVLTTAAVSLPDGWTAFPMPAGGVGYAEGVTLDELAPEALCVKSGKDGWKLAILIGRQS